MPKRKQTDSNAVCGYPRLKDSALNKGTTFTLEERKKYGLQGLLPAKVSSLEVQETRALENLRRKTDDIERYVFLQALKECHKYQRLIYNELPSLSSI